jgi:two-component system, sensor histidine kinase YesM
MLQAQINPHFINNSLQSIGNMALVSGAPNVYTLVSSLGQMMHYSMNTKETVVTLDREIDYINYYLMLQEERFEEKLSFEFDIDDRTRSILVPKMLLQPIVENYFEHGFCPEVRTGKIAVRTYLDNGLLFMNVEDNGYGITEERLLHLRNELFETQRSGMDLAENIGLANVILRLRLYFGEQAGMEIDALEPYGLRVTLKIPHDASV